MRSGQRADRIGFEQRLLRPAATRSSEPVEGLEAARGVALCLLLGDGGLTEQIQRAAGPLAPEPREGADRRPRVGREDEAATQPSGPGQADGANKPPAGSAAGRTIRELEARRKIIELAQEPVEVC